MSILLLIAMLPLVTTLGVCLALVCGSRRFVRGFLIAGSCAVALCAGQLSLEDPSTQRFVLSHSLLPVADFGGGELLGVLLVCKAQTASLLMVLSVAAGTLAWWAHERVSTVSLVLLQALYSVNVWFWLVDNIPLALVLQGSTLSLGVVLLAVNSSSSKSVAAGRSLWVALTLSDVGILLVAILGLLGAGLATLSSTGDRSLVEELTVRSPGLVVTLGVCLGLGIWGRLALFPFGPISEAITATSGWTQGVLTCFVMGSVGWRWAMLAEPWWLAVPETRERLLLLATLAAVIAGWFALCARDLRARTACLTSLAWSVAIMILLNPATSATHEQEIGVATWVWLATTLASTWLSAAWREASHDSSVTGASRSPEDRPGALEWYWSGQSSGITLQGSVASDPWLNREFKAPTSTIHSECVTTARGGRLVVLLGLIWMFIPMWLSGTEWSYVTLCGLAAAWALGTHAATCMILETQPVPGRGHRWLLGILLGTGAIVVAGNWLGMGARLSLSAFHSLGLIVAVGSMLAGVISGLLSTKISASVPVLWMEFWYGLGAHRLFTSVLIRVCLNWPIRGCAQFCRLLDSMIFGGALPRLLLAVSFSGDEENSSTTGLDPAFQALSLCIVTAVVVLTLVLQQP